MPNSSVAIDIGNYAVKAIQAKPGKHVTIEKAVEIFNSLGYILPSDDGTADKMAEMINSLFVDYALPRTDVRLTLPEALVSTKIISIPTLNDAELASAINWQAEQHIPIPLEELSLEYQVLYRPPVKEKDRPMRVMLIGVRKSVIDRYIDTFFRAGIEPTVLETQLLAVYRSLQFTPEDPPSLIVHMGAINTDMAVVCEGEMRFVYTHTNSGQLLTRTIEQAAQLDAKQAEQYKRTYGLDDSQLQGKIREILLPSLKLAILEIQKAVQFFISQPDSQPVKRILLSGGACQLPGLVQYVTEQTGMEVLVAAPFASADGEIPPTNHPAYSVCMGLLMRE